MNALANFSIIILRVNNIVFKRNFRIIYNKLPADQARLKDEAYFENKFRK
jgi:hypothetical protein